MDLKLRPHGLRRHLSAGTRLAGVALLAGVLVAACGDDDDDIDLNNDDDGTPAIELTVTPEDAADAEATATEDDAVDASPTPESDATESDAGTTAEGTEAEGTATEDDDDDAMTGTATADRTATEEDDDAATADDDEETGTSTADATTTEDDDTARATGTEDDDAAATESGTATGDSPRDRAEQIGEPIQIDDAITITVEGVEEVMGIPGVMEPEDDNRFIAIEMTVENADDDPLTALELLDALRVETEDGTEFELDPLVSIALLEDQGGFDQDINEGESVTASVAFEVPADDDNLFLVIDTDDDDDSDDDDDIVYIDLSEALSEL